MAGADLLHQVSQREIARKLRFLEGGGVTAEIFSPADQSNANLLAEVLMPDEKLRSSVGKFANVYNTN